MLWKILQITHNTIINWFSVNGLTQKSNITLTDWANSSLERHMIDEVECKKFLGISINKL